VLPALICTGSTLFDCSNTLELVQRVLQGEAVDEDANLVNRRELKRSLFKLRLDTWCVTHATQHNLPREANGRDVVVNPHIING
jgi:hypothetical protein